MSKLNAEERREKIISKLERIAEQMKETKKMLRDAYGSSGLYFGQYSIDSVRTLQCQYERLRVRYSAFMDIYESLVGEEYVNKEENHEQT